MPMFQCQKCGLVFGESLGVGCPLCAERVLRKAAEEELKRLRSQLPPRPKIFEDDRSGSPCAAGKEPGEKCESYETTNRGETK